MDNSDLVMKQITALLHEHAATLRGVVTSLRYFLQCLAKDPFSDPKNRDSAAAMNILATHIQHLRRSTERQIAFVENSHQERNIPSEHWRVIKESHEFLNNWRSTGSARDFKELRDMVATLLQAIGAIDQTGSEPGLGRQYRRDILLKANEIQRLISLYDLHQVLESVQQRYDSTFVKLERLKCGGDLNELNKDYTLGEILELIVRQYKNQADIRQIELRIYNHATTAKVEMPPDILSNIFSKLMDNAIKFTGYLSEDSPWNKLWIDIRVEQVGKIVTISFDSWGPPLTIREYKHELPFDSGYRGHYAKLMGIEGTGMGLPISRQFAREYGGDLTLSTEPVAKKMSIPMNRKTTVKLTLPLKT